MIEPFLKWPGGKRWLVAREGLFPTQFGRYIEPFLGSGAVFFHLAPRDALLSDANVDLINAFEVVARAPRAVERRLEKLDHQHSRTLYYQIRASKPRTPLSRAVRFIYLNRTCYNGMYRVNRAGEFNVPIGSKQRVAFERGYLSRIARRLRSVTVRASDFEEAIDYARRGDLIFVDPPYTVMHNSNNFVKYNARIFSWSDQLRLADAVRRAIRRGANVVMSNADHESIRELYCGVGWHNSISRFSVLASGAKHRRQTSEFLLSSYELQLG